jgi:hypothetical protein
MAEVVTNAVQAIRTTPLPTCTYNNGTGGVGATLTASSNGAFPTIDGYSVVLNNDRVVINGQATALQNGIYTLTTAGDASNPWVLTRPNSDLGFPPTPFCVLNGNTFINTVWCLIAPPGTIGTSPINYGLQTSPATTFQYLTSGSGATYTTPANCRAIHVEMIGGGGGGGAVTTTSGSAGSDTIFNSIHAKGGSGGHFGTANAGKGGAGGTGGTGSANFRAAGGDGQDGVAAAGSSTSPGGSGGSGYFGGEGRGGYSSEAGQAGKANTGGGGGGGDHAFSASTTTRRVYPPPSVIAKPVR